MAGIGVCRASSRRRAASRLASWRVNQARSASDKRVRKLAPNPSALAANAVDNGNSPRPRNWLRAPRSESASIVPRTILPSASVAS
ncbi:hypothetical protein G6F66_015517 [Rhizopus arrhizus]|nr:hypothetical protein G6F66_015517 [Rhizopus arrhizus]